MFFSRSPSNAEQIVRGTLSLVFFPGSLVGECIVITAPQNFSLRCFLLFHKLNFALLISLACALCYAFDTVGRRAGDSRVCEREKLMPAVSLYRRPHGCWRYVSNRALRSARQRALTFTSNLFTTRETYVRRTVLARPSQAYVTTGKRAGRLTGRQQRHA